MNSSDRPSIKQKVVVYPKGLDRSLIPIALFNEFGVDFLQYQYETIEDTTGTLTDNLLVYDKPDLLGKIEPELPKYDKRPKIYPYF